MNLFWLNVMIAVVLEAFGLWLTAHLVWPRWKVVGKTMFYLSLSTALSWYWPRWALIFIIGHPLLGLGIHIWLCHSWGLSWWNVDAEKYNQAQKDWVKSLENRQKQ